MITALILGVAAGGAAVFFWMQGQLDRERNRTETLDTELATAREELKTLNFLRLRGEVPPPRRADRAILAEIRLVSKVPPPETAPYADCLAFFEVELAETTRSGMTTGETRSVVLGIPGFIGRVAGPGLGLEAGDWVSGQILEKDRFSETDLSIFSIADETTRFDLPRYFLLDARKLAGPAPVKPVPAPAPVTITREESIQRTRDRLSAAREPWDGDLDAWEAAAGMFRNRIDKRIRDAGGELQIGTRFSFFRALPWPEPPFPDDATNAIVSLKNQLAGRGIDLIVAPIPPKNFVHAWLFAESEKMDMPAGGWFPYRNVIFDKLLAEDVELIDALPALKEALPEYPQVYYDGKDNHPADGAIQVVADLVADRLGRFSFPRRFDEFREVPVRYSIPRGNERFNERAFSGDPYVAHRILPIAAGEESLIDGRVLLMGDSVINVPWRYGVPDALVADHLGARTGFYPEMFRMSGSSPQILRHLAANAEILDGVEVVIFCFFELYLYYDRNKGDRFQWEDVSIFPKG